MIKTYYLYKDTGIDIPVGVKEKYDSLFECMFLAPKDMYLISYPGYTVMSFISLLFTGHRCYALKKDGKVIAFNWINMRSLDYLGTKIDFKENEAYTYFMFVKEEWRKQSVATYLKYKTLEMLKGTGRNTFYSITELDHPDAIEFKDWAGCVKWKKLIYVSWLKRAFKLKSYDTLQKGKMRGLQQERETTIKADVKEKGKKEIEAN